MRISVDFFAESRQVLVVSIQISTIISELGVEILDDAKFFLKLGLIVVQIPFLPFFVVLSKVFCVGYLLSQFLIFLLTCNCQLPLYPTFCSW